MALHWNIVAYFLYVEIAVGFILSFSFVSNRRLATIFKSNIFNMFISYGSKCFAVMLVVLLLLFVDATREVIKYSQPQYNVISLMDNLKTKDHVMMNMFRAQRNLYVSGFALFLLLLLRRIIGLINVSALLEAQKEAAIKQAESASRTAQSLLNDDDKEVGEKTSNFEEEIADLKAKLSEARKVGDAAQADVKAMKSQSEALTEEYDRLMKEHERLQETIASGGDSKKDQ